MDIVIMLLSLVICYGVIVCVFAVSRITRRKNYGPSKVIVFLYAFLSCLIGFIGIVSFCSKMIMPDALRVLFFFSAFVGSAGALIMTPTFVYLCRRDYRCWAGKNFPARVDEVPTTEYPEVVE